MTEADADATVDEPEPPAEPAEPPPPAEPAPAPTRILEALLFTADEPLSTDRLKSLSGLDDGHEVRSLVEALRDEYDARGAAFTVEEVAGGFRMLTRPVYSPFLANLKKRETEARLSAAALETLAIVAYRQPVLRADVEKIRGVDVGGAMRTLMERGLVKVVGRAEEPGSPLLYGTTKRFLEVFGLRSLSDLPKRSALK